MYKKIILTFVIVAFFGLFKGYANAEETKAVEEDPKVKLIKDITTVVNNNINEKTFLPCVQQQSERTYNLLTNKEKMANLDDVPTFALKKINDRVQTCKVK